MELTELIEKYYEGRNLKYPNSWEALGWAQTELGEAYEILLGWSGDWVRNNPQDHPLKTKEDFSEELGDVIMMIMMAGYVEGVNPIQSLKDKINRKLEKLNGTIENKTQ